MVQARKIGKDIKDFRKNPSGTADPHTPPVTADPNALSEQTSSRRTDVKRTKEEIEIHRFLSTRSEDPSFLTFKVRFLFDDVYDINGIQPSPGLLLNKENPNSAENYLERIDKSDTGFKRAEMLSKFKSQLKSFQDSRPWFYQSISGLPELWEVAISNSIRGTDKELEITMLEDYDMSVTSTIDLYRKATYDYQYMRDMLPFNMRTFMMDIQIFDIRRINTIDWLDPSGDGMGPNTANRALITMLDNERSIFVFRLHGCTFDIGSNAAFDTAGNASQGFEQTTQRLKIKYKSVREMNTYSIKDYILDDSISRTMLSHIMDTENPSEIVDFRSLNRNMQQKDTIFGDGSPISVKEAITKRLKKLLTFENRNIILNEIQRTVNHITGLGKVDFTDPELKSRFTSEEIELIENLMDKNIDQIEIRDTPIRERMSDPTVIRDEPNTKDTVDKDNLIPVDRVEPAFRGRTEKRNEPNTKGSFDNNSNNQIEPSIIRNSSIKVIRAENNVDMKFDKENVDFSTFPLKKDFTPKIIDRK